MVLTVKGDAIQPRRFADAVRLFHQLLDDVDAAHSPGDQPTIRWRIGELKSGSAVVSFVEAGRRPNGHADLDVPRLCVRGVRELEDAISEPATFGLAALGRIQRIGRVIGDGVSGFELESPASGERVEFTPAAAGHARKLLARSYTLGAVEGRLEAVNTHGSLRFTVWDDFSGYSVRCGFDEALIDEVVEALRMRTKVLVTGRVRRDADGRPREISEISELRALGAAYQRRSVLDLEGVYAAMEGHSLDYLTEIRGE
ncbi:MAG: hypothetical protein OXU19_18515 [bacterium]|nr:hypothetical protein [bacterium]